MFEAFVIVCAAGISFEVYTDNCFIVEDNWGPYYTAENCDIRRSQMVDDILNGVLTAPSFTFLGNPDQIYAEGICTKISEQHNL
jgi:hypothetical protein